MNAKCVVPGSCDNVIATVPTVSCACGKGEEAIALKALIVACSINANIATVEGLSHVREIGL